MDAARWERIKSVFQEAFDRDPAERAAWLDAACGEDLELRDAVQRLIDGHAGAGAFLETPLFASTEPPPVDHLLGRTVGPYRIDSRIAIGGMGEVYRAHDARLDRAVALKLLPAAVAADPDRLRRFHAEARAASSLNHPHILVIHDFGDADGRPFMVTEFVEGETLRERLRAGPLAIRDALDVMAQVASALSAAHARGLVHRDVKPENVMIRSDGYVKLLDFGLAKIAEGGAGAEAAPHTMTGMALGTPRYMSPEQALGQPVDTRSDVFACGAMLYEMVAGRAAFEGATPAGIFDAVLHQSPPPPTAVNPGVPAALGRVIDRALAKAPAARYQSASELLKDLNQLRSFDTAGAGLPRDGARRLVRTAAAVGMLLAVFAVWAVWNGRRDAASPSPRVADSATRLVVLPFENLTGQSADDWLAGGFSDSLTFGLQNVGDLVLVNRERISELYRAEGVREPGALDPAVVRRLSEQLAVRYYVHGSYQRVGDTIKVVSRHMDAATGDIKAQESVTDRFANVLQMQDELARRFAASFAAGAAPRPAPPPRSLEAYQAVTEARSFYADGQYTRAIPLLEQAVVLDPQYGEAWALLSKAHSRTTSQASFAASSIGAAYDAAIKAAERAVALAPEFYDAHVALALVSRQTGRVSDWRREARRAIELAPRVAEPYGLLADSYSAFPGCSSRDRDATIAADYYRRAIALDTRDATAYSNLATHFHWREDIDQAIRIADEGFARLPDNRVMRRHQVLKLVLLGRPDEAEAAFPRFIPRDPAPSDRLLLGTIRAAQNRPAEAAALFDDGIRAAPLPVNALWAARIFARYGHDERLVTYLQRAVSMEPACAAFIAQAPIFKSVQAHPAVRALVTPR